jgi:hypothetical protein
LKNVHPDQPSLFDEQPNKHPIATITPPLLPRRGPIEITHNGCRVIAELIYIDNDPVAVQINGIGATRMQCQAFKNWEKDFEHCLEHGHSLQDFAVRARNRDGSPSLLAIILERLLHV